MIGCQVKKKVEAYGEDDNHFSRIFNNDSKIESHFKTFESFMDNNVLDLRSWYKGRGGRGKEIWRAGGCLYSKTPQNEQRFLYFLEVNTSMHVVCRFQSPYLCSCASGKDI